MVAGGLLWFLMGAKGCPYIGRQEHAAAMDADGDGVAWGDGAADDCDDEDPRTRPGADETCDGKDNDCDGEVDEDPVDGQVFYTDVDGDGYGDSDQPVAACKATSDQAAQGGDCDDGSVLRSPGAAEVCGNGIDEDCTGEADDGCFVEHCGTVSDDETWTADLPHHVTCNVLVEGVASPVLSVLPGAEVQLDEGASIVVGNLAGGMLLAGGDPAEPVRFIPSTSEAGGTHWGMLKFSLYDRGSILDGVELVDGGGDGSAAISVAGAVLTLRDSNVTGSATAGVYCSDGALSMTGTSVSGSSTFGVYVAQDCVLQGEASPSFADNTLIESGAGPILLAADSVSELDGSTTYGSSEDRIGVIGGVVTRDGSWRALGTPYELMGPAYVEAVLTIQDGVQLFGSGDGEIVVGEDAPGQLTVDGTDEGVDMRGVDGLPGDWVGLRFDRNNSGSSLQGLRLYHAGARGSSVEVIGSDLALQDCVVAEGAGAGLSAWDGGTLAVAGSDVLDNAGNGVDLDPTEGDEDVGALARTGVLGFADNLVTGNGGYPMVVPADSIGLLATSSELSGNGDDFVHVPGGTVTGTATWFPMEVPYRVDSDISVSHSSSPVVTITDGFLACMDGGVVFYVGSLAPGSIITQGTSEGVVFTSVDSPACGGSGASPGDWDTFRIASMAVEARLQGLVLEYGGGTSASGSRGFLYIESADADITDTTVRGGFRSGLYATGGEIYVADSTFEDNGELGIMISSSARLEDDLGVPSFAGNNLTGNGERPIELPAVAVGQLDPSSSFTGNGDDVIEILTDVVDVDETWRALDVPYSLAGYVYVQDVTCPVLEIEAGTTLQFDGGASTLYIGSGSCGGLQAAGTAESPVTFTSASSSPSPGDWRGLELGVHCYEDHVLLSNAVVEYGGAGTANIRLDGCSGVVEDSLVRYSAGYGVCATSAVPSLSGITYVDNELGDNCSD